MPGLDEAKKFKGKLKEISYKKACDVLSDPSKFIVKNKAVYICSCFTVYFIDHCGAPMELSACTNKNCNKRIGGLNHTLVPRKGHFRIFDDSQEKNNQDYYQGQGKTVKQLKDDINKFYNKCKLKYFLFLNYIFI